MYSSAAARKRKNSIDSTEKEKTKPIKIKLCRIRDQPLNKITPSPLPENFNDFMIFQKK